MLYLVNVWCVITWYHVSLFVNLTATDLKDPMTPVAMTTTVQTFCVFAVCPLMRVC